MIIKSTIEGGFPVVITLSSNFPSSMISKVQAAANIMSEKLKKENLENFVYNFKTPIFKSTGVWPFRKTKIVGYTNGFHVDTRSDIFNTTKENIVKIIQDSNELALNHGIDKEADLFVEMDARYRSGVIGYTYPNVVKQWIYKNWLYNMNEYGLAENLAHEFLHKLGGAHKFNNHAYRPYTAVYAIGYYVGSKNK